MNLIKPLLIGTLSLFTLSGCIVTNLMGVGDTEFSLKLSEKEINDPGAMMYIARVPPQLNHRCSSTKNDERYLLWTSKYCNFGKFPPEKIDLQYAKWKPYDQIPHPKYPHMVKYADSLPASAWKTVTVYPRQFMSQVKSSKKADGTPILSGSIAAKNITMIVILDENGNVTLKDEYEYNRTMDML